MAAIRSCEAPEELIASNTMVLLGKCVVVVVVVTVVSLPPHPARVRAMVKAATMNSAFWVWVFCPPVRQLVVMEVIVHKHYVVV